MKHVIILNGAPKAGKGEFSAMFGDRAVLGSIINGVKHVARTLFEWDGIKDDSGRKLLYELYAASMEYNRGPLKDILSLSLERLDKIAIIDVRDPEVIATIKEVLLRVGVPRTTVLIRRDLAEADVSKLIIDSHTMDYGYDVVLTNNGTLEGFEEAVREKFGAWMPDR